ncbi:hypothetical protein LX64_03773 [Chitinophaga skermanii]|uniref:Uncharacterized protein n=1 Tax=Chitinophaga skermanii TaxID=331697 RepID=A0A327QIL8_9BACT|nr:hypothetical protein LX64_03773 [Chitinophaga skermanii]
MPKFMAIATQANHFIKRIRYIPHAALNDAWVSQSMMTAGDIWLIASYSRYCERLI